MIKSNVPPNILPLIKYSFFYHLVPTENEIYVIAINVIQQRK